MAKTTEPKAETARRPRRTGPKVETLGATQTVPPPVFIPPQPPPPTNDQSLEDDPDLISDEELEDLGEFDEVTPEQMRQAKADPRTLPRKPRLPENEFFDFTREYPRELADNLMFYLYRKEPAIKSKRRDPITGRIITNIDKVPNIDQVTHSMVLTKWGSGKYRIIMTDQGKKGKATKQICDCVLSINEWDKFPPVFTDPTELVDCDANASLISGLIANKTLKRDPQGVLIMNDGTAAAIASAEGGSTDMLRVMLAHQDKMLTRMDANNNNRGGSSKIEEAVAALVLKQVAGSTDKPATDPMITFLLTQVTEGQKQVRELTLELIKASKEPHKEANPMGVLQEFATTMKTLGDAGIFTGMGAAAKADAPWWESLAEKLAPHAMPHIARILTPAVQAIGGQQQQAAAPAPAATAPPPKELPVQGDAGIPVESNTSPSPTPAPTAAPAAAADPAAPPAGVIDFMAKQAAQLMQRKDMNGQDLAHSIYVVYNVQGLIDVRKFPIATVSAAMLAHPQVGAVLEMMKEDFQSFMEEFYNYDPAQSAEADESDADDANNNTAAAAAQAA